MNKDSENKMFLRERPEFSKCKDITLVAVYVLLGGFIRLSETSRNAPSKHSTRPNRVIGK